MFKRKISYIRKRDGTIVKFDRNRIMTSITHAAFSANQHITDINLIVDKIEKVLFEKFKGKIPNIIDAVNIIEKVLSDLNYLDIVKNYKQNRINELKQDDLKLNLNAIKVLQKRYLLRDEKGNVVETPLQMLSRVSNAVSVVDLKYGDNAEKSREEFFEIMKNFEFLPNSPCLMNAGTSVQQMSACFTLPIPDSLDSIFDSLKLAALIQKTGGGTGFSFSKLRPEGHIVGTTKGTASGPLSFLELFDKMTEVIKAGGRRRGANMGILDVEHPDIIQFIKCKDKCNNSNFNISVAVTDKFMQAVLKNKDHYLKFNNKLFAKLNARKLFETIVEEAWENGDPGLIFIDEINRKHGINKKIEATNPCGEQPLLDYESCVLGSINLSKFVNSGKIDWERLKIVVRIAVHFLDNIIDANYYIDEKIKEATFSNRKIGLGIMGWADFLIKLNVKYDSNEALKFAEKIMQFIQNKAREKSSELGLKRGNFPNFYKSELKSKYDSMRNLTVTTIAPTGTISIIANDCSSGIEPLFAVSYIREALAGSHLIEINKNFEEIAMQRKFYSKELMDETAKQGSLQGINSIPNNVKKIFVTAFDIHPEWHIRMQAAFQKYVDNGVSKTVNLPENANKEAVRKSYLLAYRLKCKGITVFRYGSKGKQVLHLEDGDFRMENCTRMTCSH